MEDEQEPGPAQEVAGFESGQEGERIDARGGWETGAERGAEARGAAGLGQGEECERDGAEGSDQKLHEVGRDDAPESRTERVGEREQEEQRGRDRASLGPEVEEPGEDRRHRLDDPGEHEAREEE